MESILPGDLPGRGNFPGMPLQFSDGEISHFSMLRRQKIFNMIQRDRPEIIAVDNIFELAADRNELLSLMERLPDGVKLVR